MSDGNYINPFDSDDHKFLVLRNSRGQYSLWPVFIEAPKGWEPVYGPAARNACHAFVENNWRSINPFDGSGEKPEAL